MSRQQLHDQLVAMGITPEQAWAAINAGKNDIQTAIDYIFDQHEPNQEEGTSAPARHNNKRNTSDAADALLHLTNTDDREETELSPVKSAHRQPHSIFNQSQTKEQMQQNQQRHSKLQQQQKNQQHDPSGLDFTSNHPSIEEQQLQKALELSRQQFLTEPTSSDSKNQTFMSYDRGQDNKNNNDYNQNNKNNLWQGQIQPPPLLQLSAAPDDEEFQRAIEESLKDHKPQDSIWKSSWMQNIPSNPRERKRSSLMQPVGLTNIGNTCYLNSILQLYFHLKPFRRKIFRFRRSRARSHEPMDLSDDSASLKKRPLEDNSNRREEPRNTNIHVSSEKYRAAIEFVDELQTLFGQMALSNSLFLDPTPVIRGMIDNRGNPIEIGGQQDASEFNQIFLDLVNCAFEAQLPDSMDHDSSTTTSFVRNSFNSTFYQEVSDGRKVLVSSKGETDSLIIDATKNVKNRDLYSGMDDYTSTKIDYHVKDDNDSARSVKIAATKSVWFTSVAPIVTFYLQRVEFNVQSNIAEKVHDSFDFAQDFAVDRYMKINKVKAEAARERMTSLRGKRARLEKCLEEYTDYLNPQDNDKTATRISSASCLEGALQRLNDSREGFKIEGIDPSLLQNCYKVIKHIQNQDKKAVADILKKIDMCKEAEDRVYLELDKTWYILFAVLVHDGDPSSGHYWSFVRSTLYETPETVTLNQGWLKYDDLKVSFVDESQVWADSLGGKQHASAYCLVYIRQDLAESMESKITVADEARDLLPQEKIEAIEMLNEKYDRELDEYVKNQEREKASELASSVVKDVESHLLSKLSKNSHSKQTSRIEFSIAIEMLDVGVILALCESFKIHVGQHYDFESIMEEFSRVAKGNEYPAAGASPVQETKDSIFILSLLDSMKNVQCYNDHHLKDVAMSDTLTLLSGELATLNGIEKIRQRKNQMEKLFELSLYSTAFMTECLDAISLGKWNIAIRRIFALLRKGYIPDTCDNRIETFFLHSPEMTFARRDTLARPLMGVVLICASRSCIELLVKISSFPNKALMIDEALNLGDEICHFAQIVFSHQDLVLVKLEELWTMLLSNEALMGDMTSSARIKEICEKYSKSSTVVFSEHAVHPFDTITVQSAEHMMQNEREIVQKYERLYNQLNLFMSNIAWGGDLDKCVELLEDQVRKRLTEMRNEVD